MIRDKHKEVVDRIGDTLEKGKETVARQKEQIGSALEAGKKAYQEEKSKLEGPPEEGSEEADRGEEA
jgi:hypothetical protein